MSKLLAWTLFRCGRGGSGCIDDSRHCSKSPAGSTLLGLVNGLDSDAGEDAGGALPLGLARGGRALRDARWSRWSFE